MGGGFFHSLHARPDITVAGPLFCGDGGAGGAAKLLAPAAPLVPAPCSGLVSVAAGCILPPVKGHGSGSAVELLAALVDALPASTPPFFPPRRSDDSFGLAPCPEPGPRVGCIGFFPEAVNVPRTRRKNFAIPQYHGQHNCPSGNLQCHD